ncbi:GNAT family N-acetyltransferase [Pelatocladus sp. BLCC-F211]|uniref:GNAT family N-acetyltransferase n=1 Tax=Pelatocladus sp. BLCC-F211 TaxID=3342752 RepID=UPI0035B78B69
MVNIIPESYTEILTIRQLIIEAFGQVKIAELVDIIRKSENFIPELSLIAVENLEVLGHILFSQIIIETPNQTIPSLALAPLAVKPSHQRQGIGSRLVEAGLSKCREFDYPVVIVVGEPAYYQRFGFQTAGKFGLRSSLSFPDEVFMVLELKPAALTNIIGTVRYPAYFQDV